MIITPTTANRHCFRCLDCLAVAFVETATPVEVSRRWNCVCGGKTCEYLGRVSPNRVVVHHLASACDYRCTNAPGPNCDCRCGGANHGSGRTVTLVRGQAMPVTRSPSPKNGEEYRAAVEAALQHMEALAPGSRSGAYLQRNAFWAAKTVKAMIGKARQAKTHKGRLAILAKCLGVRLDQFNGW